MIFLVYWVQILLPDIIFIIYSDAQKNFRMSPTFNKNCVVNGFKLQFKTLTWRVYMCGQVFRKVVCPGEALATHITMVRTFSRMDPQVSCQIALTAERSATEQAHERSLSRVLPYVQLQVFLRSHALAAEGTGEFTFPLSSCVVST